ncbi:MAG: radical SAM protein [Bacilli bacterium]|nr:radical SAM protein [Bacilli bacterium]
MVKDLCFEIIQKCPNNCLFCSSLSSSDSKYIISFEVFKNTIDRFLELGGIKEISISGGEPFLHPDLIKMIEYCKLNGIRTVIYTSGITKRERITDLEKEKLNPSELRIIEQIEKNDYSCLSREKFKQLKKVGLDKVVFNFQSSNSDVYNYLMGSKNQYANILRSMLFANFEELETEIHFIPLKSNYKEFDDILELAELGNVATVSVLRFVPQGRGRDNVSDLLLTRAELIEFKEIVSKLKLSKVKIRMGIPMTENDTHLCTAGNNKFDIRYDGEVLPCPSFKDTDLEILKNNNINVYNIYDDLNNLDIKNQSIKSPLCKKIHFKEY